MATKSFKVCDWCKKEIEYNGYSDVKDWKSIKLEFGQYNDKKFDLCPNCLKKLGIIDESGKQNKIEEPSTYEKLFEIIVDIVNEAIDNR